VGGQYSSGRNAGNIFCRGLIYQAQIRKIYGCFKKIEAQHLAGKW
jgi:hypothetical protein